MTVTSKTRRVFVAERTVPSASLCGEEFNGELFTQRRTFLVEQSAWMWVARGALFRKRAERCRCARIQQTDPEQELRCRYCDEMHWRPLVKRYARLLRHHAHQCPGGQRGRPSSGGRASEGPKVVGSIPTGGRAPGRNESFTSAIASVAKLAPTDDEDGGTP